MATATLLSRTLIYLHGVIIKTRGLIFALQRKSTNERRKNSIPEGEKQHFMKVGVGKPAMNFKCLLLLFFQLLHSETVMCCVPSGRVSFAFVCCTSLSHAPPPPPFFSWVVWGGGRGRGVEGGCSKYHTFPSQHRRRPIRPPPPPLP